MAKKYAKNQNDKTGCGFFVIYSMELIKINAFHQYSTMVIMKIQISSDRGCVNVCTNYSFPVMNAKCTT